MKLSIFFIYLGLLTTIGCGLYAPKHSRFEEPTLSEELRLSNKVSSFLAFPLFYNDEVMLDACHKKITSHVSIDVHDSRTPIRLSCHYSGDVRRGRKEGKWVLYNIYGFDTLAIVNYKKGKIFGKYLLMNSEGEVLFSRFLHRVDSFPVYKFEDDKKRIFMAYLRNGKIETLVRKEVKLTPLAQKCNFNIYQKKSKKPKYILSETLRCKNQKIEYTPYSYKIINNLYYDVLYDTLALMTGSVEGRTLNPDKYKWVWGYMKDGMKHGKWFYFYENPNECAKDREVCLLVENYRNNLLHGRRTVYSPKGKRLHTAMFKNGTGYFKKYDNKGELLEEGEMINGEKSANWKIHKVIPERIRECNESFIRN